ncbi:hypothetical protein BLAC_03735 [Bifidobacterium animalis subsp. lactis ATCC 27673]|nr:hypothetical protein BLAC_03735 [Bifidobacterium animalis subsp. lactis ATCC 27673]
MLSKDERERLRGLSKEHAENIGLHILAAYTLEGNDPDRALAHAKWAAKQASRVDIARETLAMIAYRQGDYKLALREFQTAFRMNGYLDYLPFMADCERGLGKPKKAIELCMGDDAKHLTGEAKAEMFLVLSACVPWPISSCGIRPLRSCPSSCMPRALQANTVCAPLRPSSTSSRNRDAVTRPWRWMSSLTISRIAMPTSNRMRPTMTSWWTTTSRIFPRICRPSWVSPQMTPSMRRSTMRMV